MAKLRSWIAPLLIILLSGCDSPENSLNLLSTDAVILAFGDSLTYGTGADHQTESYPAVLSHLSNKTVINAGVPGEISQEGLRRLGDVLEQYQPELVLLCHGGNDLLRKLDEQQLRQNLTDMIQLIRDYGAQVVMLSVPKPGIFLEPAPVYKALADTLQVPLENDIIPEIESETALKSDPIHPNAKGYEMLGEHVYQWLKAQGAL